MRAFLSLILLSVLLNACATVDETPLTLEDEPSTSAPKTPSKTASAKPASSKASDKADKSVKTDKLDKPEKAETGIVVDNADVELANRMTIAMDAFVFKNEKNDFTALCKDKRFDCLVDEKRFPVSKKKTKRKVPPFMSGSKNGIQGDHRVQVKYDFYP